jgi:hypothetical protein
MAGEIGVETSQMSALSEDDREELERLRAENARLRDSAVTGGAQPPRPGRWRRAGRSFLGITLIALGCLLTPLSVVSVWARSEVVDTNRYVETVTPLADDPAIQQAVTDKITNLAFQYIDVRSLAQQLFDALSQREAIPPAIASQLPALAAPVANGVQNFAEGQIADFVQSDLFEEAWVEANRAAHEKLLAALTGEGDGSVQVQNGVVTVNLASVVDAVKQRLVDRGFQLADRIPAVDAEFTVFQSDDLPKVQRGFDLLNTLGFWMPFICLVLIGLGIYIVRHHRLAFIGAGLGVALAMLATALALMAARRIYLDGVPSDVLPPDAAAVLYDTFIRYLREAIRAAALLGLVFAVGAFLTGPSVTARTIRRWIVGGFARLRGALYGVGVGLDRVTAWVASRARVLRVSVVIVASAILLLQRYRTPELVAWLTLGVLVALAVIQFFATPPRVRPGAAAEVRTPASLPAK